MRLGHLLLNLGCTAVATAQVPPGWSNSYQQAPNKNHYLNDMEVNSTGGVWLYGFATDTINWPVGMVVKYSGFGSVQDWAVEFMDIGQLSDIDIDGSNNAYVGTTGYDTVGTTRSNYLTKKIADDGTVLWTATYTGNGPNNLDRASALCVDGQGNVIITGFGEHPDYHFDWYTVKYDPNGNELWVAHHEPPTEFGGTYGGIDIATDAANNIYVTGESHDTLNGDFATVKYAPDGTELWVRREGGYFYSQGRVVRVIGDRVYVAGQYTYDALDSTDVLVAAYDTAGVPLWSTVFNAPPFFAPPGYNGRETIEDLQVDASGNVYFTGTEFATNGYRDDYMIVKLDPNGAVIWSQHYGAGNGWDDARSMFVDNAGAVYVTGRCESTPYGVSVLNTVKFDPNGDQVWFSPYTAGFYDHHFPGEIRWDGGNTFYVGASKNLPFGGQLLLLSYGITTAVDDQVSASASLLAPNPMTSFAYVDLRGWDDDIICSIWDLTGRCMRTEQFRGGDIQTLHRGNLVSGTYSIRLKGKDRQFVQRMVVE
jgi:hypothetical protein